MLNLSPSNDQMWLYQYYRHIIKVQLCNRQNKIRCYKNTLILSEMSHFLLANSSKCPAKIAANPAAPAPSATTKKKE